MLSRSKVLAAAALATPLLALTGSTPATASPLVASVTGTGVLSPGIPLIPTTCAVQTTVDFDAILSIGAGQGHGPALYSVKFRGNSGTHCESVLEGQGSGLLSGNVSGSVNYTRTVGALTITGNVTVDGHGHSVTAECELSVTTSVNPIKDYALTCQAVLT